MNKARRELKILPLGVANWLVTHSEEMAAAGVLVTGHKSLDTESICSAIGYAKIK